MDTYLIDKQCKIIQTLIGDANLDEAFLVLGDFVEKLKDNEMSDQLTLLKSRFSRAKDKFLLGTKRAEEDMNEITKSLIDLLGKVKRLAVENANLSAVTKLEELTKRGNESVSTLDEVSLLMAESRLLEIEIFYYSAVSRMAMNEEQSKQMGLHIQRFKEILARLRKNNP
ncbi:MAG: hypothetical protein DYG98_04205 [Haliscomenobacteraceae bacterium CHB4]|nr:hypothetical protein [Haliscomenobacteraceae bacterium CHB4]